MGGITKYLLFWSPRILGILFAVFLWLFALDVFSEGISTGEAIVAFLIHLLPTYIILIVMFISWHREDIGAVLFFATALIYIVSSGEKYWIIPVPMILIGVLFFIGYFRKRPKLDQLNN